jgi:hypothetical protein
VGHSGGSGCALGPRSVVWVEHHAADDAVRHAREKALRLELQARGITLLGAVAAPPAVGQGEAPLAENAAVVLGRTGPAAVLWLEADRERPVSWLFVRRSDQQQLQQQALGKAPLPHPPDAIDTQLFALAAASLLDQVLGDRQAPVPTPAEVAAAAPVAPVPAITPLAPPLEPLPRYFVQLGFALPMVTVRAGMEAASKPDPAAVFDEQVDMGRTRRFFDDTLAHVADADSFDDYENSTLGIRRGTTPLSLECQADGTETHAPELPSKYCVRVEEAGFVLVPALRLAFGMWLTHAFALGLVYQWYVTIDPETFLGAQSLAIDGQYVLLGDRAVGASLALTADFGLGRTETPIDSEDVHGNTQTANALSGPLEAGLGLALRAALTPRFAGVGRLRFSERFPELQHGVGLALAFEYGF